MGERAFDVALAACNLVGAAGGSYLLAQPVCEVEEVPSQQQSWQLGCYAYYSRHLRQLLPPVATPCVLPANPHPHPYPTQYHGVLWAGRRRGSLLSDTLRELREGAFALADEAIAERRQREARRDAKQQRGAAGAAGTAGAGGAVDAVDGAGPDCAEGGSQPETSEGGGEELIGGADAEPCSQQPFSQPSSQRYSPPLSQPRSLKRERCPSADEQQQQHQHQAWQQQGVQQQQGGQGAGWQGGSENAPPLNSGVLSPLQQQPELRRRRLSGELCLVALYEPSLAHAAQGQMEAEAAGGAAGAAANGAAPAAVAARGEAAPATEEEEEEVEAELAAMSLLASPESAGEPAGDRNEQQQERPAPPPPPLNFASLRARLQAALGAGA